MCYVFDEQNTYQKKTNQPETNPYVYWLPMLYVYAATSCRSPCRISMSRAWSFTFWFLAAFFLVLFLDDLFKSLQIVSLSMSFFSKAIMNGTVSPTVLGFLAHSWRSGSPSLFALFSTVRRNPGLSLIVFTQLESTLITLTIKPIRIQYGSTTATDWSWACIKHTKAYAYK